MSYDGLEKNTGYKFLGY